MFHLEYECFTDIDEPRLFLGFIYIIIYTYIYIYIMFFVASYPHFGGLFSAMPAITCIQKGLQRRQGSASRGAGGQPFGN